ncbi:hypothetical protein DICPUDRAFT_147754 [Dictyostelium purpureum]|uniref:MSP domain-containing protein n=1 Tax=Dictyostelium purpureum TaxID=5786 RepID=F0Z9B3_DICPU|nr:uncharacterized protein DICPUDRAFT_147754 [Dictyostelium purpureum]EGC39441.1 hypothetical protein DICPUDRAFT_147754 [Dictyostelium purpureum]|eukprot:XP_003283999.1 hypothetical protein DICPUDRAFT_147754 [Dictyostelium purpureum]
MDNGIIEIEPSELMFSPNSNRVGLTITNNSPEPLDLEIRIKSSCSEKFKIPYLRGDENRTICNNNKTGTVPLCPQEHQLFYVYHEPNSNTSPSSNAQLELEYKDQKGQQNVVSIPLIISN